MQMSTLAAAGEKIIARMEELVTWHEEKLAWVAGMSGADSVAQVWTNSEPLQQIILLEQVSKL